MILIGLAGSAGTGKDTIADYLCSQYGFIRFSFSDALYREVSEAFNISEATLRDRGLKEIPHPFLTADNCKNPEFKYMMGSLAPEFNIDDRYQHAFSPRLVLQRWGTEYRRQYNGPDYWLEKTSEWLSNALRTIHSAVKTIPDYVVPTGFVNTSVRFPNEANWIRSNSGVVWHVRRVVPSAVASGLDHIAEQPLDMLPKDRELFNTGTIEQLHTATSLLLQAPRGEQIVNHSAIDPYQVHTLVACDNCGAVHQAYTEAEAQLEIDNFNDKFNAMDDETRATFGGKHATIYDYEGCSECGLPFFHLAYMPEGTDPDEYAPVICDPEGL